MQTDDFLQHVERIRQRELAWQRPDMIFIHVPDNPYDETTWHDESQGLDDLVYLKATAARLAVPELIQALREALADARLEWEQVGLHPASKHAYTVRYYAGLLDKCK